MPAQITVETFDTSKGIALDVAIPAEMVESFKDLVFRGTNLWPDAPPEIKCFADVLIHGHALQNYYTQDTSPKG